MKCRKCGGEEFSFMEMVEHASFILYTNEKGNNVLRCKPEKAQTLFTKLECTSCHTEALEYELEWV